MKKSAFLLSMALCFALFAGCRKEAEKFSEEKPLALEITQTRSYYHAKNIE